MSRPTQTNFECLGLGVVIAAAAVFLLLSVGCYVDVPPDHIGLRITKGRYDGGSPEYTFESGRVWYTPVYERVESFPAQDPYERVNY